MREPGGTLDATDARYTAVDPRSVRVEGSAFESAGQYTTKLEGATPVGWQTTILVGIADPHVLADVEKFRALVLDYLAKGVTRDRGLRPERGRPQLRASAERAAPGGRGRRGGGWSRRARPPAGRGRPLTRQACGGSNRRPWIGDTRTYPTIHRPGPSSRPPR